MTLIRKRYSSRERFLTPIKTISRTKQSYKDECDVNNIISNFNRTGFLVDPTLARTRTPSFGDFSEVPTFQEAQNSIREATELFNSLPSNIRKKFSNSPSALLDWLDDDSNYDEALKLGLVNPKPIVEEIVSSPAKNDVVNDEI